MSLTSNLVIRLSTDLNLAFRKKRLIKGLLPRRYIPIMGGKFSTKPCLPINALISNKVKCALIRTIPLFFFKASCRYFRPSIFTIFFRLEFDFQRTIPTSMKPIPSEIKCCLSKVFCSLSDNSGKHSSMFFFAIFDLFDGIQNNSKPMKLLEKREAA